MRLVSTLFIVVLTVTAFGTIYTAEGLLAYPVRVRVVTTSDWTLVNITGLGNVQLLEVKRGEDIICTNNGDHVTVWVGKEQYDETRIDTVIEFVAVDPRPRIGIGISKGYVGVTAVNLKVWDETRFKGVTRIVHQLTERDPSRNELFEEIRLPLLVPHSIKLIEEKGTFPEVIAAYYPWYSKSGRHWGEVLGGEASESTHFPLKGAYDSGNRSVLERHVEEASSVGITAFASSWWGIGGYEDWALGRLADVCEKKGFKFTALYESNRDDQPETPEEVSAELNYILEAYGSSESFLRWKNKPVIFIFSPRGGVRDRCFWLEVKGQLKADTILVGDVRDNYFLSVFEGVFNYNELDLGKHKENMQWVSSTSSFIQDDSYWRFILAADQDGFYYLKDRLTVGTVIPGYNDTKVRAECSVVPRNGARTYRDYWDVIHDIDVDWVFITSWNEWNEGTEIEPSIEHGYVALEETRIQVEKWRRKKVTYGHEDYHGF